MTDYGCKFRGHMYIYPDFLATKTAIGKYLLRYCTYFPNSKKSIYDFSGKDCCYIIPICHLAKRLGVSYSLMNLLDCLMENQLIPEGVENEESIYKELMRNWKQVRDYLFRSINTIAFDGDYYWKQSRDLDAKDCEKFKESKYKGKIMINKNNNEFQAAQKLENFVKNCLIFIDTCSLMHEHSSDFWNHIVPLLQKYDKSIIIPFRCVQELQKHKQSGDQNKVDQAQRALDKLGRLQRVDKVIKLFGNKEDNFADNVFLTQFERLRLRHHLLLITQDHKLAEEILQKNNSVACKGKLIQVSQINRYGYLSPIIFKNIERTLTPAETAIPSEEIFPLGNSDKIRYGCAEPIQVSHVPEEGDQVLCNGKCIDLRERIGGGGEGNIYETNTPFVAKIYKQEKITKDKKEKLELMVSRKIQYEGVCFPVGIVNNLENEFVGCLIPKAKGKQLQTSIFIKPLFQKYFPGWKKRDTVELCITILKKIKYLNDRNIIIGDINPANILVVSPKEVYFVDTDSYQVGDFPCPVGTVNYTAPEIQKRNFSSFFRSKGNERFAIATLLFMIMVPGKPPYSQQGGADPISNIINMDFSYPFGERSNGKIPDGPWRFIWSHLTYDLKGAFYNTFKKGGRYSLENSRLSPDDWLHLFNEYLYLLDSGKYGQQDKMSEELFPTRFKKSKNITYSRCRLCGQEYDIMHMKNGICQHCLNDGEVYKCSQCNKVMFYSNYEKYIKGKPKYKICHDCWQHGQEIWKRVCCKDCGRYFNITNAEFNYFSSKGLDIPKRCPECRKKRNMY